MYGREIAGKIRTFEASGGLIHSSLVMQDRESDTYWGIMTAKAIGGLLKGAELQELPWGTKTQWRYWIKKHPETLVLSVTGAEHVSYNPYKPYFASEKGFRGNEATDKRLETKDPVFAFRYKGRKYATIHKEIEGGQIFDLGDIEVLLYRTMGSSIFISTQAFVIIEKKVFQKKDGEWINSDSGNKFELSSSAFHSFSEAGTLQRLVGFDTFWYNWSLSNPDTKLLGR